MHLNFWSAWILARGRAGSPLPAANMVSHSHFKPPADGAHGVTRPTFRVCVLLCANVEMNSYISEISSGGKVCPTVC
jgi:hypothetical protein